MTTWTQSVRVGLRPSRGEVWALRIAQRVESIVDRRMQRRADRDALGSSRDYALEQRRHAAASAARGIRF